MSRPRPFSFTSVISKTGTLYLPQLQLVLSDSSCEENGMCSSYKDQYPHNWYIWFLLLICLVALLCGIVLCCLQCWRRTQVGSPRQTMAVFAVGDLDPVYGRMIAKLLSTMYAIQQEHLENKQFSVQVSIMEENVQGTGMETAIRSTVGSRFHSPNPERCHVPNLCMLGPPPPYEEILKSN